jgi:hypothetical protein
MQKASIILILIIALFSGYSANAQNYKAALGIRISSTPPVINNSVSFKYFFKEKTAVEALLSFDPFALGALLEKYNDLNVQGLTWFYGGGVYVAFSGTRNVGAQGILGLDYAFQNLPINVSVDWKPELNLASEFSFEPGAVGVGVRFIFK